MQTGQFLCFPMSLDSSWAQFQCFVEFLTQVINNGNLAAMSHHLFHTWNYGQHLNNYQATANESVSYVKQYNNLIVSFFVGDTVTPEPVTYLVELCFLATLVALHFTPVSK